jgi:hypothetical protein
MTPDETFAAIERALAAGLRRVIAAYQNTPLTMTDGRLISFHRLIFEGGLFRESDGAGRFRQPHEPTEFRIPVLRNDRWRMATAHGAAPERVQEELRTHDRAVGAAADPSRGDPEPLARLLGQRLRLARP